MLPQNVLILIIIICIAGIVALLAYVLYRFLRLRLKEDKPSEEEILQDEMNRVLQDVEDENVARQINEYKDDE